MDRHTDRPKSMRLHCCSMTKTTKTRTRHFSVIGIKRSYSEKNEER